jgi:hypothetical protein
VKFGDQFSDALERILARRKAAGQDEDNTRDNTGDEES